MSKKSPPSKISAPDALSRSIQIAEEENPKMRAVEPESQADDVSVVADATVPDIEHAKRKYGEKADAVNGPSKELQMVRLAQKTPSDSAPNVRTSIVDDEREIGKQG